MAEEDRRLLGTFQILSRRSVAKYWLERESCRTATVLSPRVSKERPVILYEPLLGTVIGIVAISGGAYSQRTRTLVGWGISAPFEDRLEDICDSLISEITLRRYSVISSPSRRHTDRIWGAIPASCSQRSEHKILAKFSRNWMA